jgi:hypothetical protein
MDLEGMAGPTHKNRSDAARLRATRNLPGDRGCEKILAAADRMGPGQMEGQGMEARQTPFRGSHPAHPPHTAQKFQRGHPSGCDF